MKILQASFEDLAGIGIGLKRAIERHTEHECRAIRMGDNVLRYPKDIESQEDDVWREAVQWADVVQIHEYEQLWTWIGQYAPTVPVVWMLHGSHYRMNREVIDGILKESKPLIVTSTHDLLEGHPGARWLPAPVDIAHLAGFRKPPGGFRVVQARSRDLAGRPEDILKGVEVDIVTGVPHEEALQRIGQASVLFFKFAGEPASHTWQHVLPGGVGLSALEAMAMGIPVLNGMSDEALTVLRNAWGQLPFMPTTPEELPLHVAAFRESGYLRNYWGRRGLEHVKEYHDEAKVAGLAVGIYKEALDGK